MVLQELEQGNSCRDEDGLVDMDNDMVDVPAAWYALAYVRVGHKYHVEVDGINVVA